ncbi:response regulator [Brevibacillus fluminis]|uniref:Response regulator n=1 Tax=Brevibacillus fluminis TaxID=511487 RepID=A0A3M8DP05_9BACL|nr:response regulator [Brevibacillus fluminis]RNB89828.1 response regulator [Brevibacillus fluminis]
MYKLLIADDEDEIRNGLSHYFPWNEVGFEVFGQAANGRDALQFMAQHPVDVLLCDIRMPIMTGIEVARELSQQKSPTTIIFLSGFKEFDYAQQALIYGVKNYILKPTKYSELLNVFTTVKEQLDERQATSMRFPPSPPAAGAGLDEDSALLSDKIIARIKRYVAEHYKDASLEGASQLVHMNPHYISKYFKEKTGENFSDFLLKVKMNKAAELLQEMNYKFYEISELVGYSNAKNFTRAFRKFYGKSPREYRNTE